MENTQAQKVVGLNKWNSRQVFDKLSKLVADGFSSRGTVHGSLHDMQLSELEEYLDQSGLVSYSYNYSFEHENTGPPWDYLVTKKGMQLYNQFTEGKNE